MFVVDINNGDNKVFHFEDTNEENAKRVYAEKQISVLNGNYGPGAIITMYGHGNLVAKDTYM